jgi:hypothetical protein
MRITDYEAFHTLEVPTRLRSAVRTLILVMTASTHHLYHHLKLFLGSSIQSMFIFLEVQRKIIGTVTHFDETMEMVETSRLLIDERT